ncbi:MAG: glycosyltransferase [Actinobacteria bacterium]|nr:glycosyltransferase [Actinomycetota bacterium]
MRLGVYTDDVFRRHEGSITTDRAFVHFIAGLPPRVEEVVLFGRADPAGEPGPYALPAEGVRLVPLPHYPSVRDVAALLRAVRGAHRAVARELPRLDALLVFGPHPLGLVLALSARRRVPLLLGIRQDFPEYIRNRLPSRRWLWAVGVAHALEWTFRALARRHPTIVVGDELGRRYAGGAPVLVTSFSLVPESAVVPLDDALARTWEEPLRLVSVGRIDAEKNPLLLVDLLAELRRRRDWRLTIVGTGPLAGRVRDRAREAGVADALDLVGYVPSGPALWEHYRAANAFVHVSLTEGLPQVIVEAQAAGTPVVATDVGSVASAVDRGESGLLVPPSDMRALVDALERLDGNPGLRARLVQAGHEHACRETMERRLDELAAFVASSTRRGSAG